MISNSCSFAGPPCAGTTMAHTTHTARPILPRTRPRESLHSCPPSTCTNNQQASKRLHLPCLHPISHVSTLSTPHHTATSAPQSPPLRLSPPPSTLCTSSSAMASGARSWKATPTGLTLSRFFRICRNGGAGCV
jgi:hypothetical protein